MNTHSFFYRGNVCKFFNFADRTHSTFPDQTYVLKGNKRVKSSFVEIGIVTHYDSFHIIHEVSRLGNQFNEIRHIN